MKRERALQVVLVLVGLFYFAWIYFLFGALWHSRWLQENQEVGPMFLSLNMVLGAFLLLAAKQPAKHRSLIAYGAWSSLAHACTMAIQTGQPRFPAFERHLIPEHYDPQFMDLQQFLVLLFRRFVDRDVPSCPRNLLAWLTRAA